MPPLPFKSSRGVSLRFLAKHPKQDKPSIPTPFACKKGKAGCIILPYSLIVVFLALMIFIFHFADVCSKGISEAVSCLSVLTAARLVWAHLEQATFQTASSRAQLGGSCDHCWSSLQEICILVSSSPHLPSKTCQILEGTAVSRICNFFIWLFLPWEQKK